MAKSKAAKAPVVNRAQVDKEIREVLHKRFKAEIWVLMISHAACILAGYMAAVHSLFWLAAIVVVLIVFGLVTWIKQKK